ADLVVTHVRRDIPLTAVRAHPGAQKSGRCFPGLDDPAPGSDPLGRITDVEPKLARWALDEVGLRVRWSIHAALPAAEQVDLAGPGDVQTAALLLDADGRAPRDRSPAPLCGLGAVERSRA